VQFLFCSAENFFSLCALQQGEGAFRSYDTKSGDADDGVDHIEADASVSGSRCFFGQRSLPRSNGNVGRFPQRTGDGSGIFILSFGELVAPRSQDSTGPRRRDHDLPRFAGECAGDSFDE
jgi:hypothetical protein